MRLLLARSFFTANANAMFVREKSFPKEVRQKNKVRAVSEATLYTRWRPLDAYFFSSRPESFEGSPVLENKNETRHRSRTSGSIPTDGSNRIVDAEKLEQYFALPIHFFSSSSGSGTPKKRTSDFVELWKSVFVSRPLNCAKKKM